jgi:hypothetical protein
MSSLGDQFPAQDPILGQIEITLEHVCFVTCQLLALEIGSQRSVAQLVVLKGYISIGRESAGKNGDVTENGFSRFVENVCFYMGSEWEDVELR